MANVFDNLAADIYKAADIVGRELVGVIPSMTVNAGTSALRSAALCGLRLRGLRWSTNLTPHQ